MSVFDKAFYVLESDPGVHLRVSSDSELSMSTIYKGSPLSIKVATRTVQISKIYGIIYMNGADMLFTVPGSTMTLTFREGFINGKAFEYNGQNGLGAGYYKKMTSDEYADKLAKEQEEEGTPEHFGITKENCVTVSYKQDSYGNHVATFTDISGEALEYFRSLLKSFEPFISPSSLSNINLTYTTTEDFIPLRAEVRFMFSGSGSLHNMVTMKADYLVGSSVEDPVIDLSGFIETDTLPSEEEDTEGDGSSDGGIVA